MTAPKEAAEGAYSVNAAKTNAAIIRVMLIAIMTREILPYEGNSETAASFDIR
jgi:hypothetical protein